jgi:type IV pilus assembly protein PilV
MNVRTRYPVLHIAYPQCRGLTLVEIMVALLILSIGILGLASMQTASLRFNAGAYQRTQATVLASDMADRMRANRQAAMNNEYIIAVEDPAPACAAPNPVGTVAQQDISAWRSALACRLPQSSGSITRNGNEFTLTIVWDESQGRDNPLDFQFTTAL